MWRHFAIAPINASREERLAAAKRFDEFAAMAAKHPERFKSFSYTTPPQPGTPPSGADDEYPDAGDLAYRGRARHIAGWDFEHSAYVLLIDQKGRQRLGIPFEAPDTRVARAGPARIAGRRLNRASGARLRVGLEPGADEAVEVAVEHAVGVADLEVRAVVLDHRVRVQDVGADLRAEVRRRGSRRARAAISVLALAPPGARSASARSIAHRGRAVGGLGALVLALDDDAASAGG